LPDARHLVVGRLRKPHGLKGEVAVFPITRDAAAVFGAGRVLRRMSLAGELLGDPVEVERSRTYHREWLVKFRGIESRSELEAWRGQFLAAPEQELPPPASDEVYLHELEGFAVALENGTAQGVVSAVYEVAGGVMIEVQGPSREFLLPYRKEFVLRVDRAGRRLTVVLPAGLVD